ncbi:MAG: RelA/SpoT family protein, partial [bacterium]|nr:RelA/SpoT family protein [bacterium]
MGAESGIFVLLCVMVDNNSKISNGVKQLLEKVWEKHDLSEGELSLIQRAYDFAKKAHEGQTRSSGEPYITHPVAVAMKLAEMRLDVATICAALLHDVCEDTSCSSETIKKEFGEEIAFLVEGVTKLDKIQFRGIERSAESLRKMFLAVAEDIRVVLIKLMDRWHNAETLSSLPPEKQKRIALETLEVYAPTAYRLGIGEIKGHLEDLSFPYVYPKEYEWLVAQVETPLEERGVYVASLTPILRKELQNEGIIPLDIHGRAKRYYSLYKKLLKYEMDLEKVYDLVAVRVIVNTIEECYGTLGVIHKLWKPIPGLVKDYIALPKPNGYRSLHTTVFGPDGIITEFQIRTAAMHEEAERGIAAHWAYADAKGTKGYRGRRASFADTKEMRWVEQLQEWQKNFENPDEFLESVKIDFFKNRIFVLTPKGEVFDLPEGSTPIDFAYQVHTAVGDAAAGAKVNSKIVPLDYELKNGDVVEIMTQKGKKPSQDW